MNRVAWTSVWKYVDMANFRIEMDGKIVGNCIDGRKRIDKIIIAENILKLLMFPEKFIIFATKRKAKKKI